MTDDPLNLLAAMVLEDGRRWGSVAVDWQIEDARAVLTPGPDDPRLHWLGRPKGGSKTTDVAGLGIVWLLAQAGDLDDGYVFASDQDQARRLLDRAAGLIARTPGLDDRLEVLSHSIVERRTRAKVTALAADAAGAEGILAPLILVDELPQWADTRASRGLWDAGYSSIPKVANLRFVVIGHAGVSGSWQHRLYERFQASPLWRVHDVPGPLPWVDPAVLEDQRATLTDSQYARRHLNVWSSAEDTLTTAEDLRACVTLAGPLQPVDGQRYVIGLDVGLKNDATVAVVAHAEQLGVDGRGAPVQAPVMGEQEKILRTLHAEGHIGRDELEARLGGVTRAEARPVRIVLDRMEVWQGSRLRPVQLVDVEEWLAQASFTFNKAEVVVDPWQAVGLAQRLRGRGISVEEFTFSSASVGRLGSTLHQLFRDRALALPDDDALLAELASVRLTERTPGVLRMDHDAGKHDDRAMALALAATRLLAGPPPPQRTTVTSYSQGALLKGTR